jgi:hypothetical protein
MYVKKEKQGIRNHGEKKKMHRSELLLLPAHRSANWK